MAGTLKETLRSDLTDAIRSRDSVRSQTLRMVLTSVTNEEVAGTQARELSDDEVLKVLGREAKKRREASAAYAQAGRQELADQEEAELAVVESYLPAQLSDEEIHTLVAKAIVDSGATGPKQMGQVMRLVQPQIAGRADGGRVATIVREGLSVGG